MTKRIGLFLGFPPTGGGAFQYAQSIMACLSELPGEEFKIVVALTHPEWIARIDTRVHATLHLQQSYVDRIIQWALRFGLPVRLWRRVAPYLHANSRILLEQQCDLWLFPAQEVWTYACPVRAIGVIHDLMHRYEHQFPEVSEWGLYRRRERHYQRICEFSAAVLTDSELGKRHVIESYAVPSVRIRVLPYVAPTYMHCNSSPPDFDIRYSLPQRYIFYPAQFWKHKNHLRLVEAFARVRESDADIHLVLVGSRKNAYDEVRRRISDLRLDEAIHIFGYVRDEDMPVFYRRARAMIMPTFFGPTNIPPLEAMAVGCPMAISRVYGMPEQVGDAAIYFDPGSVDDIAEAMLRLAADDALCARLRAAGEVHNLRYSQRHFNSRLYSIIRSILDAVALPTQAGGT